ncbi:sulfite exporter TauE/SafE family protein [Archaeoglobus sp.]
MIEIVLISFIVPFIFALCGLGSAIALIPILVFLGVPFPYARSVGLFVNAVTTVSVTIRNVQSGEFKPKIALPIVIFSILFSPLGAIASLSASSRVVGVLFTIFLFFVVLTTIFPIGRFGEKESLPILVLIGIGTLAGFVSGLLGVGGGALILPLLITFGLNPRIAVTVTPLSVPFSSIASFVTYAKLGGVDWNMVRYSAIPASIAGYLAGTIQRRLKTRTIRRILAVILTIVAIRFALKFM